MRIPAASDITSVEYVQAIDGGQFCKILFAKGDVQILLTDELHHLAHCLQDWSMDVDRQETDAERVELEDRGQA
jgi:hypothetical protein